MTAESKELGRIKLNDKAVIQVRETEFKGEKRLDIRKFIESEEYKGPTKKGISIPFDKVKDLQKILNKVET